jgi:hypothetical protein
MSSGNIYNAFNPRGLFAGPLRMSYDHGSLRYLRLAGQEVVRAIYVALRDINWDTIPFAISEETIHDHGDSFEITFLAHHKQDKFDFSWLANISGSADGVVTYAMDGQALVGFWKSRIGICVLHPVEQLAGKSSAIETPGGEHVEGVVPIDISPYQPFTDIRSLTHSVLEDLSLRFDFSGDVFEMEDQRNWTDFSYKTYSTPLALPYPVRIDPGDVVEQAVRISLIGKPTQIIPTRGVERITLNLGSTAVASFPQIGFGAASPRTPADSQQRQCIRRLGLSHLHVDLILSSPRHVQSLQAAAREAGELDIPLLLAIYLGEHEEGQLVSLTDLLQKINPRVDAFHVFQTDETCTSEALVRLARKHLTTFDPQAKIGAGTYLDFAEINRVHPPVAALDLVTYAASPQVHMFDNRSLAENLPGLAATVRSARRIAGDLPIHLGPITLKPRVFYFAGLPPHISVKSDPRQASLFGAGWTIGALKNLAETGVEHLTFFETTGETGVVSDSYINSANDSHPGAYPIAWVFANLARFTGGDVLPTLSSEPMIIEGLSVTANGVRRTLVANLTDQVQDVELQNLPPEAWICSLDDSAATNGEFSSIDQPGGLFKTRDGAIQVRLNPHALARIDS